MRSLILFFALFESTEAIVRPGRELDTRIAKEVFGYKVWAQAKVLYENAEKGDRPLRNYSREIEYAFEVANKMKITLIPVEGSQWFAFTGPIEKTGWESPQAVFVFLEAGNYDNCGAAVGENPAAVICEAALRAVDKRAMIAAERAALVEAGIDPDAPAPLEAVSEVADDSTVVANSTSDEASFQSSVH